MKKRTINTLALAAIIVGFVTSVIAPWWAVWFVCLPVIWAGAVTLLKLNTNHITEE